MVVAWDLQEELDIPHLLLLRFVSYFVLSLVRQVSNVMFYECIICGFLWSRQDDNTMLRFDSIWEVLVYRVQSKLIEASLLGLFNQTNLVIFAFTG